MLPSASFTLPQITTPSVQLIQLRESRIRKRGNVRLVRVKCFMYLIFFFYSQVQESDENRVTIVNVRRDLTGYYKCEVSADAPTFHTGIKTKLTYVTGKYYK